MNVPVLVTLVAVFVCGTRLREGKSKTFSACFVHLQGVIFGEVMMESIYCLLCCYHLLPNRRGFPWKPVFI